LDELNYYDLSYYSRKYKEKNYQINDEEIKQYFEFNHVVSWMFDFAEKFFGITMKYIESGDQ
jgi:Zn-dependent oligopeptidase